MTKLRAITAAILVALLVVAAGCSKPSPTPPANGEQEEKITLNFMHMTWIDSGKAVVDEAIAAFTAEHPNITIEQSQGTWGEGHAQVMTALVTGTAPDIIQTGGAWAPEFVSMGAFVPIEDLAPAGFLDQFVPAAFTAVQMDGKTYGLPWEGATWAMFYRTDLFEEAGLDPTKPPTTWDELVEYAKKLTTEDRWGLVFPAKGWEPADFFMPFLWQAGCKIAEPAGSTWKSDFDAPECLEATKFYYDLINTHKVVPQNITGYDWEEAMKAFAEGKAAMMFGGMWVVASLQQGNPELDGKWATATMPAGPAGQAALGYPNTLHIAKQSKHQKEAWEFVQFFYENGYADRLAEAIGSLPWTKSFANTKTAQDPLYKPFVESMNHAHGHPTAPKWESFRLDFNPKIQELVLDQTTPEAAVAYFHERFNTIHGYSE